MILSPAHLAARAAAARIAATHASLALLAGGAARIQASGDVYGLTRIEDFAGVYTQGTGQSGLDTRSTDELWLQNAAGVVMHLRGTRMGVTLGLGRDELLIELAPS